jgi:hypothetical protein
LTFSFVYDQRSTKGGRGQQNERFARMPKNQLFDALFALFRERDHWSAKELRLRTEQPEQYLKEVLSGIATQHKSGPVSLYYFSFSLRAILILFPFV